VPSKNIDANGNPLSDGRRYKDRYGSFYAFGMGQLLNEDGIAVEPSAIPNLKLVDVGSAFS
jgi:hypothetical protein